MGKVTIKDVSKIANVSYTTVSRALSGSPEICEATRERILKICEELNYIPDSVARSMVMRRTNTLGLLTPSIKNPFMSELIESIEKRTRERGFSLMVCNSAYDLSLEKSQFALLQGRRVDGIIVIPAGQETVENLARFQSEVPVIYVSENMQEKSASFVSVDNVAGGRLGVEYLHSLGHKKILYLGSRPGSLTHQLRLQGVQEACAELGVQLERLDNTEAGKSSIKVGQRLGMEYFARKAENTAIFCATDTLALGVMYAAEKCGVRIPEDVSVLGFDNISFSDLPQIGLTTVAQPKKEMAEAAVELIIDMVKSKETTISSNTVAPKLIERTSCRANS